ncbi:MAG: hypothetical protein IKQ04_02700 [Oscillospiraceae bacterium]|nr:hypothetical protein [Oscillospiraceae bacterium]
MISFADLKKIEQSSYADQFRSGILALANRLLWLGQERSLSDANSLGALSDDKLNALEEFQKSLRKLVNGEDAEKQDALNKLKEFPAFLSQKAFADQVNSPSLLQRLVEAEQNSFQFQEKKLREDLYYVSGVLELGLDLGLSRQEQEEMSKAKRLTREMWAKPVQPELPKRGEAERGSWAALFHNLTEPSAKPNTKADEPVYEHKCSANTMRRMAALMHIMDGEAGEKVPRQRLERETEELRKKSLIAMTLRNEHTVELLRRGAMSEVIERVNRTRNDFSFGSRRQLMNAQSRADCVLRKMKGMQGKAASSPEFAALMKALKSFVDVDWDKANLQACSADVLMAVENFTKGRKNVQRSPRAQECVNLALDALVCAVPNAAANPQVKPLIDRFNQVRSARNRVSLADFGAARTNTVERIKQAEGYDNELDTLVETMGELHNGKIDPVLFEKVKELYSSPNKDITTLQSHVDSESQAYRKAAVLLLEEMAEDPEKQAQYSSLGRQDTLKLIQEKAETLSLQGTAAGLH